MSKLTEVALKDVVKGARTSSVLIEDVRKGELRAENLANKFGHHHVRRGKSIKAMEEAWERENKREMKQLGCFATLRKPGGTGTARTLADHIKRDVLRHRMYGPSAAVHRMPDHSQAYHRQHFNVQSFTEVFNPVGWWATFKHTAYTWHQKDWHYRTAFVEVCLLQPMLWFYVLLFVAAYTTCHVSTLQMGEGRGLCGGTARKDLMDIMSGTNVLNAFLFVFYIRRCFTWFMNQYFISCSLEGRAFDIVSRARAYMHDDADVMDMYRWTNLIHILGYVGLSKSYTAENFFIPMSEAYGTKDCGMMSKVERDDFLSRFGVESGGSAYRHAVTEGLRVIDRGYREGKISYEEASDIEGSVILMRGKMAQLYDYAGMPIPVVYKLAVHMSMQVWLVTFTVEKAMLCNTMRLESNYIYSAICALAVLIVCCVILSLFAFSNLVNEPFGDDIFDLPVFSFVNMIAGTTMTIALDKTFKTAPAPKIISNKPKGKETTKSNAETVKQATTGKKAK